LEQSFVGEVEVEVEEGEESWEWDIPSAIASGCNELLGYHGC
jgi:hypothetical protein